MSMGFLMDAPPNVSNEQPTASSASQDEERTRIREELSEMTFEELQELKETLGTKVYNKAMFSQSKKSNTTFQRLNKNRPREMSAKKPVTRFREVVPVQKHVARDPRFDDLSGTYNERIFQSSYSFLRKIKENEKEQLKKELTEEESPERKEKIQYLLKRLENQERAEEQKKCKEEQKQKVRAEQVELMKQGQKPFFRKSSEAKMMELGEKYVQLKKTNKLDKYLVKKRKQRTAKDKQHS